MKALRQIDITIVSTTNLSVVTNTILEQVTSNLNVDAADILLLNPYSLVLEFAAGGIATNGIEKTQQRIGQGHAGRAALEHKTIFTPNISEAVVPFLRAPLLETEDFVSYCAVPLIALGKMIGVLEVFHRSQLNPEQSWMDFLNALGGQASIAFEGGTPISRFTSIQYGLDDRLRCHHRRMVECHGSA